MIEKLPKQTQKEFVEYLKQYGFTYVKTENEFRGFYEDIVFRIGFMTSGYGSRVSLLFEHYIPLLQEPFEIFPEGIIRNHEITVFKWDTQLKNLEKKEKNAKFASYMDDMKFIIENYIYYINSAVVNGLNMDKEILESYQNLYSNYLWQQDKEDGATKYRGDFIESGRKPEAYSAGDEQRALEAQRVQREREFPYEPVKEKIIYDLNKNREKFETMRQKYVSTEKDYIKIEPSVNFIENTNEFLYESAYGQAIIDCLEEYGYFHDNRHFFVESNIFKHKDDDALRVRVVIDKKLFLRFDVYVKNTDPKVTQTGVNLFRHVKAVYEPHTVAPYIETPFAIGWLLGNPDQLQENVSFAIAALEKKLQGILGSGGNSLLL